MSQLVCLVLRVQLTQQSSLFKLNLYVFILPTHQLCLDTSSSLSPYVNYVNTFVGKLEKNWLPV